MLKKCLFLIICITLLSAFAIPEKLEKKADKVISKFYETEDFLKTPVQVSGSLNEATPSHFGKDNFFVISSEGKELGYGYIGNAPSKTATFDYLVLFDNDFIITKSKVLIYREEYGGEIGSKRWLQQFDGASAASEELVYNQDIIPISGATISVRSMTKAMNDLLKSIAVLQKKEAL